jgi:Fur family ferric uptake transcriptional regulator
MSDLAPVRNRRDHGATRLHGALDCSCTQGYLSPVAKSTKSSPDDLRKDLREAGLRSTMPRLAVLEFLRNAAKPVSHAEVAEVLEPLGHDRASIYRNLMDLTEVNLATRRDFGDHVWRFEATVPGAATGQAKKTHQGHPHFVCNDCGDVECLPGVELSKLPRAVSKRAQAVEVKGLCVRCE